MSPPDDDPRIDRLYEVPLARFTAERNALAKDLKAQGDARAAEAVRALQKPSPAAWAVNQLARRRPDLLDQVIEVGARLRAAQREALTGGDPHAVRKALVDERATVDLAVDAAKGLLGEGGLAASGANLDRIADTLYALASNDLARRQAAKGRLTHEVQRVGFGDFSVPTESLAPRVRGRTADGTLERERKERRAKLERARERAERLAGEAVEARRRAEDAEQVARAAAQEVTSLEAELAGLD